MKAAGAGSSRGAPGFGSLAEARRRRWIPSVQHPQEGRGLKLPHFRRLPGKSAAMIEILKTGRSFGAMCSDAAAMLGTFGSLILFLFRLPDGTEGGHAVHLACRSRERLDAACAGLKRFRNDSLTGLPALSAGEAALLAPRLHGHFQYVVDADAGAVYGTRLKFSAGSFLPWKRLPFRMAVDREKLRRDMERGMGPLKAEPQVRAGSRFVPLPDGGEAAFSSPCILLKARGAAEARLAVFSVLLGRTLFSVRAGSRAAEWLLAQFDDCGDFHAGKDAGRLPLAGRRDAPRLLDEELHALYPDLYGLESRINELLGGAFRIKCAGMHWLALDGVPPVLDSAVLGRVCVEAGRRAREFFGLDEDSRIVFLSGEIDGRAPLFDVVLHETAHLLAMHWEVEDDDPHGPAFWKCFAALAFLAESSRMFERDCIDFIAWNPDLHSAWRGIAAYASAEMQKRLDRVQDAVDRGDLRNAVRMSMAQKEPDLQWMKRLLFEEREEEPSWEDALAMRRQFMALDDA